MIAKLKIAISSCLLGNNVRYDGGHKLDRYLRDTLGRFVEWVPVCPEAEAGLTVPREPMRLVTDNNRMRLITIATKQDRTDAVVRWIENKLHCLKQEHIRGFILKARSPSCGIHDAELFSAKDATIGASAGLFAKAVMDRFPALPVEDEERLRDPAIRQMFLDRILL
jgi:uncharacterized protein YbbK (DUF523 family)